MATGSTRKIVVKRNGPYAVHGGIPLVRKEQVVSEYGEPLTWKKVEDLVTEEDPYYLCRCGHSSTKPFCDRTHRQIGFDGTETADPGATAARQTILRGKGIVVKRDYSLCMESGFCANRITNIDKMLEAADDPQVRALIMAMIERCPSGSYAYALEEGGPDIEPDYPEQVAASTEITADGPIAGPLWVTGGIPVERSDGQPFETRNRVTLCNCGRSKCKPLCDGQHRRPE